MLQSLATRYFYEVAQKGSLTSASETLHVAVSAISRQIMLLEQEIGSPLFERSTRGMTLTDAGDILLRHIRRHRLDTEAVLESIAALRGGEHLPIRIASTQGLANEFLPSSIAQFSRLYPHARFRLWVDSASAANQRVQAGEVDLALTFSTEPNTATSAIDVRYTHPAPALAVMSQDHPLAWRKRLALHEIQDYPLALTSENTSTYKLFQLACNMAGLWIEPQVYSNHAEALHAYVRDSQAILFASYISMAQRLKPTRLVAIPLSNPEMHARTVQIQIMKGRTLPDLLETFLSFTTRRLDEIVAQAPV